MSIRKCLFPLLVFAAVLQGCDGIGYTPEFPVHTERTTVIFYAEGFNNLSSDIGANIKQMLDLDLPTKSYPESFLIYSRLSKSDMTPVPGYLVRVSNDYYIDGTAFIQELQLDTIYTVAPDRSSLDPQVMREVLNVAKENAPADHYGLILSSHGTGWLPEGYFRYGESSFNKNSMQAARMLMSSELLGAVKKEDGPRVKSFGAEGYFRFSSQVKEMELAEIAEGIPYKMDWIIFDACFMGTVEVAYELRHVAGKIGGAPTEVLTSGFDYDALASSLFRNEPKGFCEAYYDKYHTQKDGVYPYGTICLTDCTRIDSLANVCGRLFSKYRNEMSALTTSSGVQEYFRESGHNFFYDLQDIMVKAGISAEDAKELQKALDYCITYKAATDKFIGLQIKDFCGLSMFMPSVGAKKLKDYYRGLAWNKATGLVL